MERSLVNIHHGGGEWREIIRSCGQNLITGGYIEASYLEAIIQSTLDYGPYYVVDEGVAIAHAPIDTSMVHQTVFNWTNFKEPVIFEACGIKRSVSILIILATTSATGHQELLRQLAIFLMNPECKKHVCQITDEQELWTYLTNNHF